MEGFLHEVIGRELRRRHGIGMMEGKLRPVHVANALMRSEHGCQSALNWDPRLARKRDPLVRCVEGAFRRGS